MAAGTHRVRPIREVLPHVGRNWIVKVESSFVDSVQNLNAALKDLGLETIDKREKGGCLWVIGGADLYPFMIELRRIGFKFNFTSTGGNTSSYRAAWYLK